jgi:AraC family transcriptional regulator, ethanolamine operon transcriptional activator
VQRQLGNYQKIVERFDDVIRANLGTITRVDQLAAAACISPRTLLRAFRVVCGTTPFRYLREVRLDEARYLLASAATTGTVTEIAARCGFRSLDSFSAGYRASFGERPSETRQRANDTRRFALSERTS